MRNLVPCCRHWTWGCAFPKWPGLTSNPNRVCICTCKGLQFTYQSSLATLPLRSQAFDTSFWESPRELWKPFFEYAQRILGNFFIVLHTPDEKHSNSWSYTLGSFLTDLSLTILLWPFQENQDVRNSNDYSQGSSSNWAQCNKLLGKVLIAITFIWSVTMI